MAFKGRRWCREQEREMQDITLEGKVSLDIQNHLVTSKTVPIGTLGSSTCVCLTVPDDVWWVFSLFTVFLPSSVCFILCRGSTNSMWKHSSYWSMLHEWDDLFGDILSRRCIDGDECVIWRGECQCPWDWALILGNTTYSIDRIASRLPVSFPFALWCHWPIDPLTKYQFIRFSGLSGCLNAIWCTMQLQACM